MANPESEPFYLIVTDHDRGVFAVEGPMTDDRPWKDAALFARNNHRRVVCGPSGADRDALATDYHQVHRLAGVPPGSIVRPRPT
ncbi:MAG: hypothetical protein JSS43_15425 [Proteobacteria bacterium]|nr:hypothetical protein [Pseudomonadota bacterium]